MASNDIFVGIDGTTPDFTEAVHFEPSFDLPMSFVNQLFQGSAAPKDGKTYLPGPDIFGKKVPECISLALDFIMKANARLPAAVLPRITIAGYSRGAYAAIRVAQGLNFAGLRVHTLLLIDTVKVTDTATETRVGAVLDRYDQDHDVESDANRSIDRLSRTQPMSESQKQAYRTGTAQRYGRTLEDRIYAVDERDAALGAGNAAEKPGHFVITPNVDYCLSVQRDHLLGSHQNKGDSATKVLMGRARSVMGTAPVTFPGGNLVSPPRFWCTHSAMGGMPYRGDLREPDVSKRGEWMGTAKVAAKISSEIVKRGVFNRFYHETLNSPMAPTQRWLNHPFISEA